MGLHGDVKKVAQGYRYKDASFIGPL
jgi:hypothetical protein